MSNARNWPRSGSKGVTIGGKHTFRDWSLVSSEIPVVNPPKVKTSYTDIPEGSGSLDFTGVLTGKVSYENRTGEWEFAVLPDTPWSEAYSSIMGFLQGKKMNCILDDDPAHFYTGRFSVNEWKSKRGYSTIVIEYNLEPYKFPINDSTAPLDWLWNDLFNNTIYYGTFRVTGTKARNLINPSGTTIMPKFTCSAPMSVSFNGASFSLPLGTTSTPGFNLAPGDNNMTFSGNGTVLVDYVLGAEL